MKCAIYSDSGGYPSTLIATTQVVSVVMDTGWVTFPFSSSVILQAGPYWLSFIADSSSASSVAFTYDLGDSSQSARADSADFSSEFTSSFGTVLAYDAEAIAVYATYTTGDTW